MILLIKAAISKLASASKVKRANATNWLCKQGIWKIYLPRPKQINFSHFDVTLPNEVRQADILFLPHDGVYKYALTVVDVASRYKQAEPLKRSNLLKLLQRLEGFIIEVHWPNLLHVDPGKEFQGMVLSIMKNHIVTMRRWHTALHRDQAIVERFNRTLAERLFGYQYAKQFIQGKRSHERVKRLPGDITALNKKEVYTCKTTK